MSAAEVDPDKKARWCSGTAVAMLLAGFVGFLPLVSWWNDHQNGSTSSSVKDALTFAVMMACISFWVLFPIVYFGFIRKSAATLEYQRLVREGEQSRRRSEP